MDHVIFFKALFESIPDYRNKLLLMFLIRNDVDFLQECGSLKYDFNRLCLECKRLIMEQNDDNLDYSKKEEKSIIERILNK